MTNQNKRDIMYKHLLLIFTLFHTMLSAQISVKTERLSGRYEAGETAIFKITGAANGTVTYQIKRTFIDSLPLLASGTATVVNGEATIVYQTTEPAFLTCKITQDADLAHAGAGVSIERLQPLEDEPADFDAFWTAQKAAVRAVPMNVNVSYVRTSGYSNIFNFDIAVTDGKRVYGYLVVPISLVGSYPAVLLMPSFGSGPNVVTDDVAMAERAGVLSVFLSAHNDPPNVRSNVDDYLTDGIQTPQSYYLKYVLLGAVKTIDYLQTRPDFNGQVATMGTSQGGGLSALIAGIDNRVGLLAASYPSFCHQAAAKYQKPSAFPYTYNTAYLTPGTNRAIVLSTIKYYDPVYALRRFKGVSFNATSYKDYVCPPEAVLTAFNQIKGQKINVLIFDKAHTQGPDEFFNSSLNNSIYAFMRRHFTACRQAPWPYNPPTLGYVVSAGKDTVLTGNTLNLTGFVGVNDTAALGFPVKWAKIEGNGTVVFSDSTSRNPTVTFSQSGIYRLRFYGYDYSTIGDNKYFILSNDIVIGVNTPIPVELKTFAGTVKDEVNELTWTTASETNNQGFDVERSEDTNRWQTLDFVKGKGNATQVTTYNFTDNAPLPISYYRLHQIDNDGRFKYSNTISLIRKTINAIQLFPNPANTFLSITLDKKVNGEIKIYDVLGRILLSETIETNYTTLNINHLAKGTYFITIKNGPSVIIKKFIKI